jgi:NAD(P)-dependent dehydrogenase (short-subunit alcohol dehydrogenase family)
MKLSGKAVLITGAGRGLGKALALELSAAGAKVALVARDSKSLQQVEKEIRKAGGEAYALPGDVSKKEEVYPLIAQAAHLMGPIDLLVNNASTLGDLPLRDLVDTGCEDLGRVLETNLVGPFRFIKAVVGNMWLRGEGVILNISSDAAVEAYPRWGAYSVSKAALDHLTRIFAEELKGSGLSFLSVDPGEMDTRMHAEAIPDADRSQLNRPEEVAKKLRDLIESSDSLRSGGRIILSQWKEQPHDLAAGPMAS